MKPKSKKLLKHSFWNGSRLPVAIAHRGGDGAGVKKENTVAAFKAAWDLGYEYGETDSVVTSDGLVIAIHGAGNIFDSVINRRIQRKRLQKMTLKEIRSHISVGGERVPLLEEVLRANPKMRFFIDAKTDEVVEPLAALLLRLKVLDRVCLDSFNYQRLQRLMKLLGPGSVASALIIGRGLRLVNHNLSLLKKGSLTDVEAVALHHSHVSPQMIDLVHSQGLRAQVWTANSKLSIENAMRAGADGIVSDNIRLLQKIIGVDR